MTSSLLQQENGLSGKEQAPAVEPRHEAALAWLGLEQARAVEKLTEQSRGLRAALDASSDGLCLYDAAGRVAFCNRRFVEIYRLGAPDSLIGALFEDVFELQRQRGTAPVAPDHTRREATVERKSMTKLEVVLIDGRSVRISDHPTVDGGWVSAHSEIAEASAGVALSANRFSLQALIDVVPDNLWVKDIESRFVVANNATATQIGLTSARDLVGKNDMELHPRENALGYIADEKRILTSGRGRCDYEELVVSPNGRRVWVSSTKLPLRDATGAIVGLIGISRDITARKLGEQFRQDQAAILESIAVGAPLRDALDAIVRLLEGQLVGLTASIMMIDESRSRLRQVSSSRLPAELVAILERLELGPTALTCGAAVATGEMIITSDISASSLWTAHRDLAASADLGACWSTPILSPGGETLGVIDVYAPERREPTEGEVRTLQTAQRLAAIAIERKLTEDRIHFMATHDALTGLVNRALLKDRVTHAMLLADRYDRWAAVALVDLDNFKYINDSLGHAAGDEVLRTVAKRMRERLNPTDAVVRMGGDEFVIVLCDQPKDVASISGRLADIQASLAQPIEFRGRTLCITSSIGAACYPADADTADALLAHADSAMYHAKEKGRDNLQFYVPAINSKSDEKLRLQEEMRAALLHDEFRLYYQPQIDLSSGAVLAVEALIRWQHPERGLLAPAAFVAVAEETGLIAAIGEWVIREACRQNKTWQDEGLPPIRMCVNVSARQFREHKLVDIVKSALTTTGLAGDFLELELTESLIMHDVQHAVALMRELRLLGVQLAIDDFGTGYSSLAALKIFPVARLKIDKSFVNGLPDNPNDSGVTAAVIALARNLNLKVIAEGVETAQQAAFLRAQNCDEVQGYHFSRPVPPSDCAALLAKSVADRAS